MDGSQPRAYADFGYPSVNEGKLAYFPQRVWQLKFREAAVAKCKHADRLQNLGICPARDVAVQERMIAYVLQPLRTHQAYLLATVKGKIAYRIKGRIDEQFFKNKIRPLLQGLAAHENK